jgi:hypothetical protein
MVADSQSGGHQGGVSSFAPVMSGTGHGLSLRIRWHHDAVPQIAADLLQRPSRQSRATCGSRRHLYDGHSLMVPHEQTRFRDAAMARPTK